MTRLNFRTRRGITYVEVLVLMLVLLFLASVFVPACSRARVNNNGARCANNLRQIGQAILLYSNENRGAYPRTLASAGPVRTPTWGTGVAATQPFAPDGPAENDVTAA